MVNGDRGTLANEVATVAQARLTPWFEEIEQELGPENLRILQTGSLKARNTVICNIRRRDHQNQLQRLEGLPTTELYRGMAEQANFKRAQCYIKCNTGMREAIRLIHAIRAGNSDLKAQQYLRH